MKLFSERYGYTKPNDVIIRERLTPEIINAICSCYDRLRYLISTPGSNFYYKMGSYIWTYYMNNRESDYTGYNIATEYIKGSTSWYEKLNLLEFSISYFRMITTKGYIPINILNSFIVDLNFNFERLNFAYKIIDDKIVEITSKEEIDAIDNAIEENKDNIKAHLHNSLDLLSRKPIGDYRNSIKESISAVEAFCREKTDEETFGKALNKLEKKGFVIPSTLKSAFEKLYSYTNNKDTGIRHALMDDSEAYVPSIDEAIFMLVSCSAFLNYLNKKSIN